MLPKAFGLYLRPGKSPWVYESIWVVCIEATANNTKSRFTMLSQCLGLILLHLASTVLTYPVTQLQGFIDIQIHDKISLYSIALDTKNFALLSEVLAIDIVGNYGLPPPNTVVHGLAENQKVLKAAIDGMVTQETISTIAVDFIDESSPNSTAYLVANYFGKGNLTGQLLSVYGKYEDSWAFEDGSWKIKNRILSLFVSVMTFYKRWKLLTRNYKGPGTIGNPAIMS